MVRHNATILRTAQENAYRCLLWRAEQVYTALDDHCFAREAACLLSEIHANLRSDELPADLVVAYVHLEQDIRARMQQRQVWSGRPLF